MACAAQNLAAGGTGDGQGDLPLLGIHPPPVHRVADHLVHLDHLGIDQWVVTLQLGQVDDLSHQIAQPGRLNAHPAGELPNGLWVISTFLHRLGEQGDSADRGLELVADIGHEVAADLLDLTRAGLVVRQHQNQVLPEWGDLHGEVADGSAIAPGQLEIGGGETPLPAYGPDQLQQPGRHDPAAAYQACAPRGAGGLEHLVMSPDHHAGGVEHGQHLSHAGRNDRTRRLQYRRRVRAAGTQTDPHGQRAKPQTHHERHQCGPDRVHEIDSKVPGRVTRAR